MSSIVEQCKAALQDEPGIEVAVLYGSCARGTQRADSDVDIAVAAAQPLSPDERVALATRLALKLGRDVDILDLRQPPCAAMHQALTCGRPLFVRNKQFYGDLLYRIVCYEADDLRYYRRILDERRKRCFHESGSHSRQT